MGGNCWACDSDLSPLKKRPRQGARAHQGKVREYIGVERVSHTGAERASLAGTTKRRRVTARYPGGVPYREVAEAAPHHPKRSHYHSPRYSPAYVRSSHIRVLKVWLRPLACQGSHQYTHL
ncbi:unnamed protein product [Linum trigynum]|uniref:Uncharacterized protein n=1 Tax=Linum trigynum TaxID=586398 RepID=A0AAV2DNX7_9ROSI